MNKFAIKMNSMMLTSFFDKLKKKSKDDILFFSIISLLFSFIFSTAFFIKIHNWGIQDWDQHFFYAESARKTILYFSQFPLWNMYHCGGMSEIGNPQNIFLSPFFLVILLFGSVVGYKILFFIHLWIGFMGVCFLAKHFTLSRKAACLSALMYICSGLFLIPFASGMTNFLNVAWIPWITLFLFQIKNSEKPINQIILISVVLTNMFFFGFHYIGLVLFYLFTLSIAEAIAYKNKRILISFFSIVILFACLSAIKLLPSIELIQTFPRYIENGTSSGYSLESLFFSLLSREQTFTNFHSKINSYFPLISNFSYGLDENGMYVGLLGFSFFLVGIIKNKKINSAYLIAMFFFLIVSFGNNFFVDLFGLIEKFPFIGMMNVPQRYRFFFMLFFVLLCGLGFDWISSQLNKLSPKKSKIFLYIIILFFTIDIWFVHMFVFKKTFSISPFFVKNETFKSLSTTTYMTANGPVSDVQSYSTWSNDFSLLQSNVGSLICYEPLPIERGNVVGEGDELYLGEAYLLEHNNADLKSSLTPNIITVDISNNNLNETDNLIINRNFDRNWWVWKKNEQPQKAKNYSGLISTKVNPNDSRIYFIYLPSSFLLGFFTSTITIIILIYNLKKRFAFFSHSAKH